MSSFTAMPPRVCEPELMDDPQLDRDRHVQALRGMTRIHIASRTLAAVWPWIRDHARRARRPLRVLDIATGGGDLPLDIAARARRIGLALEVAACDISGQALAYARLRARRRGLNVRFLRLDVAAQPLPPDYDIITSGLFLHHLTEPQAIDVLRRMAAAARNMVLVDDLRRTRPGLWLAQLATHALSRSPIVHADGPQSVRAAFTSDELRRLADAAGLHDARIVPHWPQRHLLAWERTS
jgi:2-polyprenyl-3-methyl-5-hydroxy-6-metoxy-1,4-benzoquinol methylase